jgi:hypothetical protein
MTGARIWLALAVWAVGVALGCHGCEERAKDAPTSVPSAEEPEMVGLDVPMHPEFLRLDHRLMELGGPVDFENRYQAAVMVSAVLSEEEVLRCSGAAISRHVVLTAGHCVCKRRQERPRGSGSQTVMDASACLEVAKVETVFYKPPVEKGTRSSGSRGAIYHGKAHPHPSFKAVLDERGRVVFSHADLALVILNKPLEFPGVPLSDGKVQVGDPIIIVGHEYDEVEDVFGGERRFSMNTITRLGTAEDERILVQQPGGHRYRQDSGGPCLRQGTKGGMLVGVSNRWLGEGAAFTSIHGYQAWLRDSIQHAEAGRAIQP